MKRYVREFANDRKNDFSHAPKETYNTFCKYADRVIRLCERGMITNLEAVKMIADIDVWELNHGAMETRFNGYSIEE